MGLKERARARRKRMVCHRASSFEDAERWDIEFWQDQTPEARLSALASILRDVRAVKGPGRRERRRGMKRS
jgi:hypothetical protein